MTEQAGFPRALLVVLCACSACSSNETPHDENFEFGFYRRVTLEPADLSTDTDASDRLAVRADQYPGEAPAPPSATLRVHPSGETVPTTIVEEPEFASPTGIAKRWVLNPVAPLADGWYAIVVQDDGVSDATLTHERDDGAFETRFRVGSEPLLLRIQTCQKDDGKLSVELGFSEQVTFSGSDPSIDVLVGGSAATCSTFTDPSTNVIYLQCDPTGPISSSISVAVGTAIVSSSSGQVLATSTATLPHTFELPTKPEHDGCRHWRETVTPVD